MAESKADREAREAAAAAAAGAVEPVEGGKVRVPQADGEIVLTSGADVVLTKRVTDGHVSPSSDAERALLLASVPGATLA